MDASVVINGLILNLATIVPFTNPTRAPDPSPAAIPTVTLPVLFMITVAMTPAQASTEPTDRSKFPEARQNNIVQATIPTVETASNRPRMFTAEKKLFTKNEQPAKSAASTSSMPARSQKAMRRVEDVVGSMLFASCRLRQCQTKRAFLCGFCPG